MKDYFAHWLEMGKLIPNPPAIFHVNWFRTDADGNFIWPGYGENMRVLLWILDRVEGKVGADVTPIGYTPRPADIDVTDLDVSEDTIRELLRIDVQSWLDDVDNIRAFYDQIENVPQELEDELSSLKERLIAAK